VAAMSFPQFSYLPLISFGELYRPPNNTIAFSKANFGFCLERGESMSEGNSAELELRGFRSLAFANNLVWIKEHASRDDYIFVQSIPRVSGTGRTPDRYLTMNGFQSYLQLIGLTTRICEVFHHLSTKGLNVQPTSPKLQSSFIKGWKNVLDYVTSPDAPMVDEKEQDPQFVENKAFRTGAAEESIASVVRLFGSTVGMAYENSMAAVNLLAEPKLGFITSGRIDRITSHGKIFKYHSELALPDVNLIGDVIGRRFLTCLGSSREEQFSNLQSIKIGLAGLRLTSLGDEMAHLYKCLDIAIEAQCGCVPFFTGPVYEGCVLMGGVGSEFSINGDVVVFEGITDLKNEFLTVSDHSTALHRIASKFPESTRDMVMSVRSMVRLRELCLDLECSADDRDYILQQASRLEFGPRSWPISPAKLQDCFKLLTDLTLLDHENPISRLCLFSRDAVLIALSCFGEKSTPSWDIPQGQFVSLKTPNPPIVPAGVLAGSKKGVISDATWVMTVRQTDLLSAVDEFRRMAKTEGYRAVSSVLARKQGMRVFSRDQMAKFWGIMQEAYRHVNPDMLVKEKEASSKRKAADSGEGPAGVLAPKRRALGF
jgi:hypothetical protein